MSGHSVEHAEPLRRCKECGHALARLNHDVRCFCCQDRAADEALPLSEVVRYAGALSPERRRHLPLPWLLEDFSVRQLMVAADLSRHQAVAAKDGRLELSAAAEARLRAYTGPARKCAGMKKGWRRAAPVMQHRVDNAKTRGE